VFSALKKTESKVHKEDKTYGDCVIFLKPHFRLQSIKLLFYKLLFLIFLFPLLGKGQEKLYFSSKVDGEDIQYFSPYHEYASLALLTRCNGESPIRFNGQLPEGKEDSCTYQFLIGHSSGTSSGERKFDFYLNGSALFTLTTLPKQKDQ
jgi:hypothetical protein